MHCTIFANILGLLVIFELNGNRHYLLLSNTSNYYPPFNWCNIIIFLQTIKEYFNFVIFTMIYGMVLEFTWETSQPNHLNFVLNPILEQSN